MLLLLRFLVPLAAIANETIFDLFLAPEYEEASLQLDDSKKELRSEEKISEPLEGQTEPDKSFLDKMWEYYDSLKDRTDVRAKIEGVQAAANKTTEDIIKLIILFMVQTFLLPLLFAWLGFSTAKSLVRYALEAPKEKGSDSAR